MEAVRLDSIIRFTIGKNTTRLKGTGEVLYTPDDFEEDLQCVNEDIHSGICIVNLIKSKMAPLSRVTSSKCLTLTSNFLKCEFDPDKLDSWYLCYQFNEGRTIEQQVAMYHQGSTLSVKKLTLKTTGDLEIILPCIERQRLIGKMYKQSIIQHSLMCKQAEDTRLLTMEIIKRLEGD